MITIGMNYHVLEGKQEVFVQMFNKVLELMGRMEGHQDTHLYQDTNDRCSFLIVSEWSSKQAFDDFTASEQFAKVTTWGREKILSTRPRHRVYGQDSPADEPRQCPARHAP